MCGILRDGQPGNADSEDPDDTSRGSTVTGAPPIVFCTSRCGAPSLNAVWLQRHRSLCDLDLHGTSVDGGVTGPTPRNPPSAEVYPLVQLKSRRESAALMRCRDPRHDLLAFLFGHLLRRFLGRLPCRLLDGFLRRSTFHSGLFSGGF
jgi:hypothetical protein